MVDGPANCESKPGFFISKLYYTFIPNMNILGWEITKSIDKQVASVQATAFANALSQINFNLNNALPTINFDAADYQNTFKTIGAVYEVTDLIAKKVLNCPFVFYKITDKAKFNKAKAIQKSDPVHAYVLKQQSIVEIDQPDLMEMLTKGRCNPYQTGSQFLWSTVLSFLLQGNSYIHHVDAGSKAKELYCFPNMTIAADPEDMLDPIRGYILQPQQTVAASYTARFEPNEIQHIKTGTPAPVDRTMQYLYGVAPLRAYLESLRAIAEGKTQASKQAKNGGAIGFISPRNPEDQWTKEQKDQLKEVLVNARKSNGELARILPSSVPIDWTQIGLSIADLNLLELVSASEEDVYRAFHVPLSYHNQAASTDNNVGTEVLKLIYDAVAPICDIIGEAFTVMMGKGYGGITIELDYTQLPEMAVNMKSVADYLKSLPNGVLTPNEMRAVLKYGEKDLPYLNEHYVLSTMTTMQRVFDGTNQPAAAPATDAPPST